MSIKIEDSIPAVKLGNALVTDQPVTLGSTLAVTGAATFSGAINASGVALTSKRNVLASSGNTTMTAAMSGSVMLLDSATVDYVLPAIGTGDVGMYFDFLSTVTSTNQTITAGAADLLCGSVTIVSADVPTADIFAPDVTDDLVLAMNGSTTGGVIGSYIRFTAISATRWFVQGTLSGSGTATTPFS